MSARSEVMAQVDAELLPGESVLAVAVARVNGGQKKAIARSAVATAAAQLLLAAVAGSGFGVSVMVSPPTGFVVVTTERVTVVNRKRSLRGTRVVFFLAPRLSVDADLKGGLLNTVNILDRTDRMSLLRLKFGVRHRAAHLIVEAVRHGAAATTLR